MYFQIHVGEWGKFFSQIDSWVVKAKLILMENSNFCFEKLNLDVKTTNIKSDYIILLSSKHINSSQPAFKISSPHTIQLFKNQFFKNQCLILFFLEATRPLPTMKH